MWKRIHSRPRYETLVAQAAKRRASKKIVFDPNNSKETLQEWLEHHKPSEIQRKDGIGWISVLTKSAVFPDISLNIFRLQDEWGIIIKYSKHRITLETIQTIAIKHNDTIGKWKFQVSAEDINDIWTLVATSLVEGNLSKCCLYGKVKPLGSVYRKNACEISVYNENFTNTDVVNLIEHELRKLRITSKLFYKTDAFTHCRIYQGNTWGLPSFIYSSTYDQHEHVSEIHSRLSNPSLVLSYEVIPSFADETKEKDLVTHFDSRNNVVDPLSFRENGISNDDVPYQESFSGKRINEDGSGSCNNVKKMRLQDLSTNDDTLDGNFWQNRKMEEHPNQIQVTTENVGESPSSKLKLNKINLESQEDTTETPHQDLQQLELNSTLKTLTEPKSVELQNHVKASTSDKRTETTPIASETGSTVMLKSFILRNGIETSEASACSSILRNKISVLSLQFSFRNNNVKHPHKGE